MTDLQKAVLSLVERRFDGYCTGDIAALSARQPGSDSNRQHSALIGRALRALEKAGLVRRLDDKKPVVWCRQSAAAGHPPQAA